MLCRPNAPRHKASDRDTDDSSPDRKLATHLEKDTIALAAGTVTAALAANAAAMGSASSPEKVLLYWIEHPL